MSLFAVLGLSTARARNSRRSSSGLAARSNDGIKKGTETDVDCGGVAADRVDHEDVRRAERD